MARLTVGLWLDVHSAVNAQRGTAIPMSLNDVVVEMNRCFNAQCLMRQGVKRTGWGSYASGLALGRRREIGHHVLQTVDGAPG